MTPLLEMTAIDKAFSGVSALVQSRLEVRPGEVHALIGQNGAGKSTLIKILTGAYRRDGGSVIFDGAPVNFSSPRQSQDAGIATIYQELNLVPLRTVTENVTLGYEPRRWGGFIDWRRAHQRTREILDGFGVNVDVRAPLERCSTAIQQLVAIARAVSINARLVIMDEPTSSLDDREVDVLFGVIDRLRRNGVSVLYVSHFLDELFRISDRVTIMRDGRTVGCRPIAETSKLELIADMLGRDAEEIRSAGMTGFGGVHAASGERLLAVEGAATLNRLKDFSMDLRRGEIVGLGGLLGSGRTEAAKALFGVDRLTAGSITLKGARVSWTSPRQAISAGLGFLTEDRKSEGIIPDLSLRENLTLAMLPKISRRGRIRHDEERRLVERFIRELDIKAAHMDQPVRELSGGNQQKVLLARWLALEPELLILDEPTRGVDVGAKAEIQRIIRDHVEQDISVLLISSEFEELVEGADRIFLLHDGRTTSTLRNPGVTEDMLIGAVAHNANEASVQDGQ
ncbi:MAG: sugar ABC transporter ATP-binding protein [Boseongicola sp.]|nr:sugar ABC transporter ATP-binding protein [Boseongicola sp.]